MKQVLIFAAALVTASVLIPPQAEAFGGRVFIRARPAVVVNAGAANVVVRGGIFRPRVVVNAAPVVVGHGFAVRSFGRPVIVNSGFGYGVQSFGVQSFGVRSFAAPACGFSTFGTPCGSGTVIQSFGGYGY